MKLVRRPEPVDEFTSDIVDSEDMPSQFTPAFHIARKHMDVYDTETHRWYKV